MNDTIIDNPGIEQAFFYSKNINSFLGFYLKTKPKIIVSVLFDTYLKKGPPSNYNLYKLNDVGNIIEFSNKYLTSVYSHDNHGNLIHLYNFNSLGVLKNKTSFYSTDGIVTEAIDYNRNDKITAKYNFIFDENRNCIECIVTDASENKIYCRYTYTYDINKRCIKRDMFFIENPENNFSRKFIYDESGLIISEETYSKFDLIASRDFKYSDFDNYGNWKTCYCKAYDDSIEERTIIY